MLHIFFFLKKHIIMFLALNLTWSRKTFWLPYFFSSICQLSRRYINRSWESNGRWLSHRDIQISGTSTLFCAKNIERVHSNKLYKNKTFGSIVTIWIFDVFCIETVRCLISQVHLTRVQFQQLLENNPNENLNTFFKKIISLDAIISK